MLLWVKRDIPCQLYSVLQRECELGGSEEKIDTYVWRAIKLFATFSLHKQKRLKKYLAKGIYFLDILGLKHILPTPFIPSMISLHFKDEL